jgi:hypothetical protein
MARRGDRRQDGSGRHKGPDPKAGGDAPPSFQTMPAWIRALPEHRPYTEAEAFEAFNKLSRDDQLTAIIYPGFLPPLPAAACEQLEELLLSEDDDRGRHIGFILYTARRSLKALEFRRIVTTRSAAFSMVDSPGFLEALRVLAELGFAEHAIPLYRELEEMKRDPERWTRRFPDYPSPPKRKKGTPLIPIRTQTLLALEAAAVSESADRAQYVRLIGITVGRRQT